jgi:6-phosphogluconolactonase
VLATVPPGTETAGCSTAEVVVHPSGRFVYVSNRGQDSIACFRIDETTGRLTASGYVSTLGRIPRHFTIDPSGRRLYAANQESDSIVHFDLDPDTGGLRSTGEMTSIGAPVCILFS